MIFAEACRIPKTGPFTETCDKTCGEHVSRLCKLTFVLDVSLISFYSHAIGFDILCSQFYFGDFKFLQDSNNNDCPSNQINTRISYTEFVRLR